ncbi:MAG: glucokinase [Leptolyngbyaceae cyanobacterium bins.349]|nr:glucokinase [Leptolyngbyaceae cyanobacterium bins.349]
MTILLAGDIGGTKTILRLVRAETGEPGKLPALTSLYEVTYPSREFVDLVPMVRQFMNAAQAALEQIFAPVGACFGIAGPVLNNTSKLTNLGWLLESEALEKQLKIPQVNLINDFAAVGYGVLCLQANDVVPLRAGVRDPQGAIAIIGAGTGLGQGYVIPYAGGGYRVFATEGGHTDFAPRTELEYQLWRFLKEHLNIERISTERVVSGTGIHSIYSFMRSRGICEESPEMAQAYETWQQEIGKEEKTVDLAAMISQHAIHETDYLCIETMNLFVRAYGAEAGNLALKLLPYGGVYIAGGIAGKNLPLLQQGDFVEAFNQKGRVSSAIEQIPIYVVQNPRVGLIGSALCASQMLAHPA